MANYLKQPIRQTGTPGGCINCCWYKFSSGDSTRILRRLRFSYTGGLGRMALKAFGYDLIADGACDDVNTYISAYINSSTGYIDVWKAYRDNLWSSSVEIQIWGLSMYQYDPASETLSARVDTVSTDDCPILTKSVTLPSPDGSVACGKYVQVATLTVNDDGSYSLS